MKTRLPLVIGLVAALLAASNVVVAAPSDSQIKEKVEQLLRRSLRVGQAPIEVDVRQGTVVLTGTAERLSQDLEARELATQVSGVLSVEDRVRVDRGTQPDDVIASDVKRRFDDRPNVANANLKIDVDQGRVTLSGKVTDGRVKFAAMDAAAEVRGVIAVREEIQTPSQDDATILRSVQHLLGGGSLIAVAGRIKPEVKDGVVTLRGNVRRVFDRDQAERIVLGINGVKGVVNELKVVPKEPIRDLSID